MHDTVHNPSIDDHISWGHGGLRAAVFGMSDGLVSTSGLVLGMAGAAVDTETVLLAGIAGLMAGAFSMAAGEWVSVASQAEALRRQLDMERDHLVDSAVEERVHMIEILQSCGLKPETAAMVTAELEADPDANLNFHARIELGIDPTELGAPAVAAGASFLSFILGGLVPILPWFFGGGEPALWTTVAATSAGLFALGASISLFTNRHWLWSGTRQLLLGGLAGGLTFWTGRFVGGG